MTNKTQMTEKLSFYFHFFPFFDLQNLQKKYGSKSPQITAAISVLEKFIPEVRRNEWFPVTLKVISSEDLFFALDERL